MSGAAAGRTQAEAPTNRATRHKARQPRARTPFSYAWYGLILNGGAIRYTGGAKKGCGAQRWASAVRIGSEPPLAPPGLDDDPEDVQRPKLSQHLVILGCDKGWARRDHNTSSNRTRRWGRSGLRCCTGHPVPPGSPRQRRRRVDLGTQRHDHRSPVFGPSYVDRRQLPELGGNPSCNQEDQHDGISSEVPERDG